MKKTIALHLGDCLSVMPTLPECSIDSIVTDPPYGITFMGSSWDHGVPGVPFWKEALRVAKPGSRLLAFGGTRTFHRLTCAIEDAGWEIHDCIMWVFGTGFPKSQSCLKPAWEPIILARKKGTKVLPLNIEECRIEGVKGVPASGRTQPRENGWGMSGNENTPGFDPNIGRYPANLIHDGSDEVVELFPSAGGGFGKRGGKRREDNDYGLKPTMQVVGYGDEGTAARFFYCSKASKADRGEGNKHCTVKPFDLMKYLCRLITPKDGIILDPFMGSGSTGKAAVIEGFNFIGIEKEKEYISTALTRIPGSQLVV